MKKTLLVLRYELTTTVQRRSFLLVALGVPLLAALALAGIGTLRDRPGGSGTAAAVREVYATASEGFVDQSGLIIDIPPGIPSGSLVAFADEAEAQAALAAGEVSAYYLIPADYVSRGELFYVYPDSRSLTDDGQPWVILRTLLENLVGGNTKLAERVWSPWYLTATRLEAVPAGSVAGGPGSAQAGRQPGLAGRYVPALAAVLLFACLMINGTLLSESVAREKENRTAEVLMLSISPRQMFAGKIAGLGLAGLLQAGAWIGAVCLALRLEGRRLSLPAELSPSPYVLAWGILLFLLGYAMYAGLMAGVGALSSRLKETGQASLLIAMPLFAGYVVAVLASFAGAAQHPLAVAFSLFPFTAPVVMLMRLADGSVPLWQLLLSAGLMALTAAATVRAVAAMFHAQHLLSGQPFSARRYLAALLGAAGARPAVR